MQSGCVLQVANGQRYSLSNALHYFIISIDVLFVFAHSRVTLPIFLFDHPFVLCVSALPSDGVLSASVFRRILLLFFPLASLPFS